MRPFTAADVDTQFALHRCEAALQCADDAGSDSRGMSIHAHDGPK